MAITKTQWEQVRSELWDCSFGNVQFTYQGHRVNCASRLNHKRKLVIQVYLNDYSKDRWILAAINSERHPCGDPEVALLPLFWNVKRSALYTRKEKEALTKIYGKRRVKQEFPNLESFCEIPSNTWGSATRMIAQFKKVEGLELVKIGYRDIAEVEDA